MNLPRLPELRPHGPVPALRRIGLAATAALYDELALQPKPGLVSFADNGSHRDMDAQTFLRSLYALRPYFGEIAWLGWRGEPFEALQACGIAAEARMLAATGGINTHRGAVFSMGLLCAAAGAALRASPNRRLAPGWLRNCLVLHWGEALECRSHQASMLPGGIAARRHGLRSASMEAAAGFPTLFECAWPALESGLRRGLPADRARLDALFHAMAVLDDTNLVHRGGMAGLAYARHAAQTFIANGGAGRPDGPAAARALHHAFVARRLSPGGAADTLAAACLLQRLQVRH
jgi:triphosphoribosyl-dephospho-CoA synthase